MKELEKIRRLEGSCRHLGIGAILVAGTKEAAYMIGPEVRLDPEEVLVFHTESREFLLLTSSRGNDRALFAGARIIVGHERQEQLSMILSRPDQVAFDPLAIKRVKEILATWLPIDRFVEAEDVLRLCRLRKTGAEIGRLRRASAAADLVMEKARRIIAPGLTELELARQIDRYLYDQGIKETYFDTIVASGPNSGNPNHKSGDRVLMENDVVLVDYGGPLDGYNCDLTRTFLLGNEIPEDVRSVYQVVQQALEEAMAVAKPGVPAKQVDRTARNIIADAGYRDFFPHYTGHGIGLDGHEDPQISEAGELLLEPGMVFSLEPGIYLPGKFGVRIEEIVVLTAEGVECITHSPRTLTFRKKAACHSGWDCD